MEVDGIKNVGGITHRLEAASKFDGNPYELPTLVPVVLDPSPLAFFAELGVHDDPLFADLLCCVLVQSTIRIPSATARRHAQAVKELT